MNYAGVYDHQDIIFNESKMFDNDPTTTWISNQEYKLKEKIIGVEFKVIFFLRLSRLKI